MQDLCGVKTDVFSRKELVGYLEGTVDGIGTGKGRSWKEKRRRWGGGGGGAADMKPTTLTGSRDAKGKQ